MVAQYDQQCICIVGHIVPPFYSGGASVFCFSVGLKCEEGMGRRSWGGGGGWKEGERERGTQKCATIIKQTLVIFILVYM